MEGLAPSLMVVERMVLNCGRCYIVVFYIARKYGRCCGYNGVVEDSKLFNCKQQFKTMIECLYNIFVHHLVNNYKILMNACINEKVL